MAASKGPKPVSQAEYDAAFPTKIRAEALKQALDIRKFEIDLYWKRATYFWALIAVAFAGYFALLKEAEVFASSVVSCIGLLFSVGWYCVNRGSGAWQRNWESHVDLLEDGSQGPLYKTVVSPTTYRLIDILGPFYFSPSRINNILSLAICAVWAVLVIRGLRSAWMCGSALGVTVVAGITLVAIGAMLVLGKSRLGTDELRMGLRVRSWIKPEA